MSDKNKIVDNIMNSLNIDFLDTVYGANRGLNGLSGGGLDYLGNKFGFDSQMRGYLQALSPDERKQRESIGDYAEVGGNLLLAGLLPLSNLRVPYNSWQIGRAHDRLKRNPYKGKGKDVITKMKNHNDETVLLQRGEAIKGEDSYPIVHGKRLKRETGTERNFGLNKIIYKHKTPREEVVNLPKYIKNKPIETSPRGQDVYRIVTENGEIKVVTTPYEGNRTIASMHNIKK